jgi:hypothetical protein
MPDAVIVQVVHMDGTSCYIDAWGVEHQREVVVEWDEIDIVLSQMNIVAGDTIQISVLPLRIEE